MPTNKPMISLAIDKELLQAVENFRYENRFPTRTAAILYLIRKGLQAIAKEKTET